MLSDRVPHHAHWPERAACRGLDTDMPPPELCAGCPVQPQCLSAALADNIREGRWGGFTVDQRDRIRARHADDVYAAVNETIELREVPNLAARAAATARHPSTSPATRAQLALPLDDA